MSQIIEITNFLAPELDIYARLSEVQLLNRHEPEKGIFIAESPKVIERALNAGCVPIFLKPYFSYKCIADKLSLRTCKSITSNEFSL